MKISSMEQSTLSALDSSNPFATQIPAPIQGIGVRKQPRPEPESRPESGPESAPEKKKRGRPANTNVRKRAPKVLDELDEVPQEAIVEPEFKNPIIESRSSEGMPSYRCEFGGRDIFVGKCWYKTTNPVTSDVISALMLDFGKDKIRTDTVMGDAMIYHSRNKMAELFLQTDAKWLFMIDDDIIPSIGRPLWLKNWVTSARAIPDAPLQRHVLHRLVGAGKSLVAGAYFGRQEGGQLMCSNQSLAADARLYNDRVDPVDWVGTGCMLIHRKVFEDIRAKNPELESKNSQIPFDYFRPNGFTEGEDISFCKRAKAAGHQPHVDLGLPVFHVGYKTY